MNRRLFVKYHSFAGLKKISSATILFIGVFLIYSFIPHSPERFIESDADYVVANVPECKPARKFTFLKTYKCGTTTILKILFKIAEKYNLIQQEVDQERIRGGSFNRTFVTNPSIKGDFIADHIIWNKDEVMSQLGPTAVAFTVLRDPYSIFESYYSYRNLEKELGVDLKGFIQLLRQSDPMNWNASSVLSAHQITRAVYEFGLAFNLGMPYASLQDDKAIDNHIIKIEKEMDLVMISERMEESLILFRYLMCWQPEDIVAFNQNVRRVSKVVKLDKEDKKELKRWLKADQKIYNHFAKILEEKVDNYPGDIQREMLKRIDDREQLRADCFNFKYHEGHSECHEFWHTAGDERTESLQHSSWKESPYTLKLQQCRN